MNCSWCCYDRGGECGAGVWGDIAPREWGKTKARLNTAIRIEILSDSTRQVALQSHPWRVSNLPGAVWSPGVSLTAVRLPGLRDGPCCASMPRVLPAAYGQEGPTLFFVQNKSRFLLFSDVALQMQSVLLSYSVPLTWPACIENKDSGACLVGDPTRQLPCPSRPISCLVPDAAGLWPLSSPARLR